MVLKEAPKVKLSDGNEIPSLGLGTWKASPGDVYKAVCHAIDVGYRHFDCALIYQNEDEIGRAIRSKIADGVVKREDLFITSKCWNTFHPRELVAECFKRTMASLDIGYLDLWLMHWPFGFQHGGDLFPKDAQGDVILSPVDYIETWKGMEDVFASGKIRSLGVSNFNSAQIERLLSVCKVKPVMNQVESHPYLTQTKLRDFCEQRGIKLTAYCPLGSPDRPWASKTEPALLQHPRLIEIGAKYGKSSAAVLLRFQLDRGLIVIPKSATPARIEANLDVFDFKLSPEELKEIESFNSGYRFCGLEKYKNHPYYPFNDEF